MIIINLEYLGPLKKKFKHKQYKTKRISTMYSRIVSAYKIIKIYIVLLSIDHQPNTIQIPSYLLACDECTWHHKTFLVQLYWHLAVKLYCIVLVSPSSMSRTSPSFRIPSWAALWSSSTALALKSVRYCPWYRSVLPLLGIAHSTGLCYHCSVLPIVRVYVTIVTYCP